MELCEVIGNSNEILRRTVIEKALLWREEAGVIYAIMKVEDERGLPGVMVRRPIPKDDLRKLELILHKYGVKRVLIAFEVADEKTAGKFIGKGGRKAKIWKEYLGRPIKVFARER